VNTLEAQGLSTSTIVTDRHAGINKYIRDDLCKNTRLAENLVHYFDIWHVAKSLKKKLDVLGKKFDQVASWKRSIINHLYYCAATVPAGEPDLLEAMWKSVANHVEDEHQHEGLYPMCDHRPLVNPEDQKDWIEPGSPASVLLREVLHSKMLLKDVRRLSPQFQTSTLEAFHSLIIRFAPKHTHFGWLCQYARYCLAALHFNENSNRMQAVTHDGQPRFRIQFPKSKKGEHTLRMEKTAPTYGYTRVIMRKLLQEFERSPTDLQLSIKDLRDRQPPTLASGFHHPNKAEAVKQHMCRFPNQ
jgi:hypothetical protein